ncbi:hypothetical protein BS47DRAFT_1356437, partial [Hydnum rufescens UP504]
MALSHLSAIARFISSSSPVVQNNLQMQFVINKYADSPILASINAIFESATLHVPS